MRKQSCHLQGEWQCARTAVWVYVGQNENENKCCQLVGHTVGARFCKRALANKGHMGWLRLVGSLKL